MATGTPYFELMTLNIRFDNIDDGVNRWTNRLPLIEEYLTEKKPGVLGMQEALSNQITDLENILPGYDQVSAGRADGKSEGEACPIFFRKNSFELKGSGHFWLSETPSIPGSMSWDTQFPRIVTWVKLRSRSDNHDFFVFNTHFSHVSEQARNKSAALLRKKIKEISGQTPAVLMGDFNAARDSGPYNTLIGAEEQSVALQDAERIAQTSSGGETSFNDFDPGFEGKRIDFIFVSDAFEVKHHSVDEVREDGKYISDHYPVRAEVKLKYRQKILAGD